MSGACRLSVTHEWFEKAVPAPALKNQYVQLGVHFEEVAELIKTLDSRRPDVVEKLTVAHAAMEDLANLFKTSKPEDVPINIVDFMMFLDALCDQIVTAIGCAYMHALDIKGAMVEVNDSNFSKFVNGQPVFNEHGKIMKGPDYFIADLSRFI
jgi:predicted HAD superfamily Cof-like phosphohydrolase